MEIAVRNGPLLPPFDAATYGSIVNIDDVTKRAGVLLPKMAKLENDLYGQLIPICQTVFSSAVVGLWTHRGIVDNDVIFEQGELTNKTLDIFQLSADTKDTWLQLARAKMALEEALEGWQNQPKKSVEGTGDIKQYIKDVSEIIDRHKSLVGVLAHAENIVGTQIRSIKTRIGIYQVIYQYLGGNEKAVEWYTLPKPGIAPGRERVAIHGEERAVGERMMLLNSAHFLETKLTN